MKCFLENAEKYLVSQLLAVQPFFWNLSIEVTKDRLQKSQVIFFKATEASFLPSEMSNLQSSVTNNLCSFLEVKCIQSRQSKWTSVSRQDFVEQQNSAQLYDAAQHFDSSEAFLLMYPFWNGGIFDQTFTIGKHFRFEINES